MRFKKSHLLYGAVAVYIAGTAVIFLRREFGTTSGENATRATPLANALVMGALPGFQPKLNPEQVKKIQARIDQKSPEENTLRITYPVDGSVFPPDLVSPTLTWENPGHQGSEWLIDFNCGDSAQVRVLVPTRGPRPFNIDNEAVPEDSKMPLERSEFEESWSPQGSLWTALKKASREHFCQVNITGYAMGTPGHAIGKGTFQFKTSKDSVAAPIFYRDVPFLPILVRDREEVLPLDKFNMKFIRWRLRDISRPESKVVLKDMPTCANCHSFSANGKYLAMDIDGTQGDKGAYGVQKVARQMTYDRQDIISWNYDFKEKIPGKMTRGFLSSISPDGNFVVSTVNEDLFVVGYMDPGFIQVFYPTRGILAYWSKAEGRIFPLPGANDPRYVHCSPTWAPDGKSIIFSRALAKDPFRKDQAMPKRANDPEETPIQYDLYRIPFNGGKGGKAVPVVGASANGMSNSFAKVTPDGRFIIWVQARNGLLMRPDSRLFMVPVEGGVARLMNCNTTRMNSWHSLSPNSRWMVFSSKQNSVYTQLFLTHIDSNGMDTPPVLLPNSTADNRSSNIPEFAAINYDDLDNIDVPAISHFRYQLRAGELIKKGEYPGAIAVLRKALSEEKRDVAIRSEMMVTLGEILKDPEESVRMLKEAIATDSGYQRIYFFLGYQLEMQKKEKEALTAYKTCLIRDPENVSAMVKLVKLYLAPVDSSLRNLDSALFYAEHANAISYFQKPYLLQNLARVYSELSRWKEAEETAGLGIQRAREINQLDRVESVQNELGAYQHRVKFTALIQRNPG